MNKKIIYIDMDGVLADFDGTVDQLFRENPGKFCENTKIVDGKAYRSNSSIPGIFGMLKPVAGALDAVKELSQNYDLFVLSSLPWGNATAAQEKVLWLKRYFGEDENSVFYKRIIFSSRKDLAIGDYLIDDRPTNGAEKFPGKVLRFGGEEFPDWRAVLDFFEREI